MNLEQVQREVVALSVEERLRLAVFLRHLERVNTTANQAELSRLDRAIDEGDGVTLEQWRRVHAALEAEGL